MQPTSSTANNNRRRLLLLLVTWYDLWEVLERAAPGVASRLTGYPFTATADPDAVLHLDPTRLRPTDGRLLRRAATLWGGRWCAGDGQLTQCHLGLPSVQWHLLVC